jgi:hypothetical protein
MSGWGQAKFDVGVLAFDVAEVRKALEKIDSWTAGVRPG